MTLPKAVTFLAAAVAVSLAPPVTAGQTEQQYEAEQQAREQRQREQQQRQQERELAEQQHTDHSPQRAIHETRSLRFSEVFGNDESYARFAEVWNAADMDETLDDDSHYTILVPVNDAFDRLPEGQDNVRQMLQDDDREGLRELVRYHIVEDDIRSDGIEGDVTRRESLNGHELRFTSTYGSMTVNEARVTQGDIRTADGTIHRLDTVLLPDPYDSE